MTIKPRRGTEVTLRKLAAARGVVVNGPRQSGKSELLRLVNERLGGTMITLDNPQHLRLARTDPTGLVSDRSLPLIIDEVQRGGDPLVLALKVMLDAPGGLSRLVVAGSTRFLTEPRLSESLAGRVRFVDLWPFTQGEIGELGQSADSLLDRLLAGFDDLVASCSSAPALSRTEVYERLCRGGFPEAVAASTERDRREFFADYVRTVTQRDIRELRRVSDRVDLPAALRLLGERTASVSNASSLGAAIGVSADTMSRYLPLIDTIFLTVTLPAFAATAAARTRRRPKLHIADSGLAAWLVGTSPQGMLDPSSTRTGQLLETFVVTELLKQAGWSDEPVRLSHFRDAEGREVDLVIETGDGRVAAIEVKAAIDADPHDFRHLAYLRDRLGKRFRSGVVIHCGREPARWGDRLASLPVSALWSPAV